MCEWYYLFSTLWCNNFEINLIFFDQNVKTKTEISSERKEYEIKNVIILKGLSVVKNCLRLDHERAFKVRIYKHFLHSSFLNFHQLQVEHSIFWVQCTYSLHCTIHCQVYCFLPIWSLQIRYTSSVAQTIAMHWTDFLTTVSQFYF